MKKLLRDLSFLSGLRDRQAMDFALVKLIGQSDLWQFNAVRLLRAVGPDNDQHWVTLGKVDRLNPSPERDQFWFDTSTLPRLSDFAQREEAVVTESWPRPFYHRFSNRHPGQCLQRTGD